MVSMMVVTSLLAIIIAVIALVFAILSYAKQIGLEKSTHQIQYVNAESYSELQNSFKEDERTYYDANGDEITDPEKKEELRLKELGRGFEEAYSQE